jgi:hypothetical protein
MARRTAGRVGGWQRTMATAALVVAAGVVMYAHDPFSMVITFRSTWNGVSCGGDGVCGDAAGNYQDLLDGVEAWSNSYGNIQLVTTASASRRLCVDFPSAPTRTYDATQLTRWVGADANALDGCYQGAFNTLANNEYGATDIGIDGGPNPLPISAWVYFVRNGIQYELNWNRNGMMQLPDTAPPLQVTYHPPGLADRWSLQSFAAGDIGPFLSATCTNCRYVLEPEPTCPEGCATLSVFSTSKPRGRVVVANFVMPLGLDAERAVLNQRRKRGK